MSISRCAADRPEHGSSTNKTCAIARWPWAFVHRNAVHASYLVYAFLALLMTYDWWSTRKVQRVTLWASAFLVFVFEARLLVGKTAAWHSFAAWVQATAR